MDEQSTILQPNAGRKAFGVREELLQIKGLGDVYHGCDQNWYKSIWQRMSGCGPTTASSLFLYHRRSKEQMPQPEKAECLKLMEEFWGYITPTYQGVHTTGIFCEGAKYFAKAQGLQLDAATLDVPKEPNLRPVRDTVVRFLEEALKTTCPLRF